MTKLALRGLFARRLRSALTALAVLLGVTMISGTFVLTDTIKAAFDDLFVAQNRGADAIVSARKAVDSDFTRPPALKDDVLERIAQLPEVTAVAGQLNDIAALIDKRGEVVQTGGAPTIAATYMPPPFTAIEIKTGRPPERDGEIALDADTAGEQGFRVGDRVKVAAGGPLAEYELVGLATFGSQTSLGGATVIVFDLATAQRLFDKEGQVDFAFVAGRNGQQQNVVRAVQRVLPPEAQVRSAEDEAEALADDVGDALSFLTTGLLAFAFIAVLVGAFLIFNTFNITVAQRTRELALLRMLGAGRRQVLSSVLVEALLLGGLGAILGLVAGFGFAQAINALFEAIGLDLPSTDAVIKARTVIVCLLTGVLVTLLGALGPALRATRVAPIEALREGAAPPRRTFGSRVAPYLAGVLIVLGGVLVATGTGDMAAAAGGAVVLIIGVVLLSPALVKPAAGFVAAPFVRTTQLVGRLAKENAVRNPGRTSVTAAALMIGLALVVFVTIFANGFKEQITEVLDQTFAGDVIVQHQDGFSSIPAAAADAVREVPGVRHVVAFKAAEAQIEGIRGDRFANGIETAALLTVYRFDWRDGDDGVVRDLTAGDVLLEEGTAEDGGFEVGDRVRIRGVREQVFTVRGIYSDPTILSGLALPIAGFDAIFEEPRILGAFVDTEGNVDARLQQALAPFPEAAARDRQEQEEQISEQITQILGLFYGLLAMSVLISAVGIVNTLTLSIHERTRELGLLRAVGMTRRDVRRMVRYESVITAAFGAALGLLLGLFFAWVVTRALESEGITFAVPVGQIAGLLVFALLVGVGAALQPARKAARLDVLKAISYE